MKKIISGLVLASVIISCTERKDSVQHEAGPPKASVTSITGKKFYAPEISPAARATLDSNLLVAKGNFEEDPTEENYIWLGRRLAYLYKYDSAIRIFSDGLKKYPQSFRLYRHRGHRYITVRNFDAAIADLTKASELMADAPIEIEPDGVPNKLNIPLSNTQFNVWYHLGLAHYLKGNFAFAENAYRECLKVSDNDDLVTATVDWLYMTCRRAGKHAEAKKLLKLIHDDMKIVENDSYFKRLKMYQGKLRPEEVLLVSGDAEDADLSLATQGYGVGNWYLVRGNSEKAKQIFERVVAGKHFSAFGFIAAEVELSR